MFGISICAFCLAPTTMGASLLFTPYLWSHSAPSSQESPQHLVLFSPEYPMLPAIIYVLACIISAFPPLKCKLQRTGLSCLVLFSQRPDEVGA